MSGKFALIIGNTEYADPGLAQLTAPSKDTEDFARILKSPDICAFDDVNILLNQPSYVINESIDTFFYQKKPDDLLIVYFSGHGIRDEFGVLYLAVKNTNRTRLRATAIRSDYLREAMDQSRSKRQVVILDCCNSGAFPQGAKAEVGGMMGMMSALQGYGRFVLTASDATQFAWEGDKVIGETRNSLFTHFLVKGLEGDADSDGNGKITVDKLYDYAYDQISRVMPKQTPTKSTSKQEGDIVLREITRLEQIKPVSLPSELIEAMEDSRTFVREGAVQQLEKLLKGKNLGLARSAREALERIEREDDSRGVSQAATKVLMVTRQAEQLINQKNEEERRAFEKEEAVLQAKEEKERKSKERARFAALKAEEESLAREKAELERRTKEEVEHIAGLKAELEQLTHEKADAERRAQEEAEKLRRAQVGHDAAEREATRLKTEREVAEKVTLESAQKTAQEKAIKEAGESYDAQRAERKAVELVTQAAREAAEKTAYESYFTHRKQMIRQIVLPVMVTVILVIALIFLVNVATFTYGGDVARWAAISTMWIMAALMIGLLLFLLLVGRLIYLLAKLLNRKPRYAGPRVSPQGQARERSK